MSANQSRDVLDDIDNLRRRIRELEASRTLGAQAFPCTSTTHPANPAIGRQIVETDTGLRAWWNGSAWVYDPQLIAKRVLTASAASVTFSSIPQQFTNLRLVVSAKSDGTGSSGYDAANLQFNGVTAANYNWNTIWVTQGGAISTTGGAAVTSMQFGEIWNSHFGSQGRGIVTVEIPNYADGNAIKSFTSSSTATDGGAAGILQSYGGALNNTTAAITSMALLAAGNFVADSTFCLYGM